MSALSVIIPTLNEEHQLPALLADLRRQQSGSHQVIVCDGGSSDQTCSLAHASGARIVASRAGRGLQMNQGAAVANGDDLLFLHADCRLGDDRQLAAALDHIKLHRRQLGHDRVAGHFGLRFERCEGGHDFMFRFLEAKTRSNRPGTINGDQGLLISRRWFDALGGFDSTLPFLEDQRIAAKILAHGQWLLLPGELRTSARRFETEGHGPRLQLMALMMLLHHAGESEFFQISPRVYRPQSQTGRLRLAPFVRELAALVGRRSLKDQARLAFACGRYARQNAWQLAFALDLLVSNASTALTDGFDQHLARILDNPAADIAAIPLVASWLWWQWALSSHVT